MMEGSVDIGNASVEHTMTASSNADIGANLLIMDVALAAASIPITLGGVGIIKLKRKMGKTSVVENESRIEYRVIRRSLLGSGRQPVNRDIIPKYQSSLASQGEDEDEDIDSEDAGVSMSEIQ